MARTVSLLIIWLTLNTNSCKYLIPHNPESPQVLTYKSALIRSNQVQNVHYYLSINLMDRKIFRGSVEIVFDLVRLDSPLRVDFANGEIQSIRINNEPINSIKYESGFFMISMNHFSPGVNKVFIEYTHPYSRSGNGLHTFNDPKDGETYIYSQFETNHAKSMFPCFDQPDVKATYQLDVIHPRNWIVISSNYPKLEDIDSESNKSSFPRTSKFSTYVFSLHAGPYSVWKDNHGNIPLRLFARKSMKDYVDSAFWFKITKEGFNYFERYFNIHYPFGKYDQIIVPEFNFGAMENIGAVTYSERFLSRGQVTRSHKEKLASVILHEMAHMWFGNLVTMKWWGDLWLNESFATYMAAKAQYEATEFKEAWETFFIGMKSWAYREDKSSTTHPIYRNVNDTEEAFTNFDGITYGKGASVLKQLEFFIGEANFREGVSRYLKNFSYSNATLGDFLHSLEYKSNKDLKSWSREWIESDGFNRIQANFTCTEDGRFLKDISILQDHITNTNTVRTHRTEVGLYKIADGKVTLLDSQKIEYSSSTEFKWENETTECPDFIYPNYGDHDYVRVDIPQKLLDEHGLNKIRTILKIDDNLTSLMLWRELNEEVREGDLSMVRYSNLALELLELETRDIILDSNIGFITGNEFPSYNAILHLKKDIEKQNLISKLETWTWDNMMRSKSFSDRKRAWFKSYLNVGYTENFKNRAYSILQSNHPKLDLKIDQDLRWNILIKLCSLNSKKDSVKELIEKELKADNTKLGRDSALACESAIADPVLKGKWMNLLLSPNDEYSASTLRNVMYNIFPINQLSLQIPFIEFYFQNIRENKVGGDENFQEAYSELLAPRFCSLENIQILKRFINQSTYSSLPKSISKSIKQILESEEECHLIIQKSTY